MRQHIVRCRRCGIDRQVNQSRSGDGMCRDCQSVERALASQPTVIDGPLRRPVTKREVMEKRLTKLRELAYRINREIDHLEQVLERAPVKSRALRALCGTESGYSRHRRVLHEPACEDCKAAHRIYERERVQRQRAREVA